MSKADYVRERMNGPAGEHSHRRRYQLGKRYGITADEYDAMLTQQGGVCAICLSAPDRAMGSGPPRLVVDHNHFTDEVRALLCFSCNVKLSAIEDEQFMLRARAYLRKHGSHFLDDASPEERAIGSVYRPN